MSQITAKPQEERVLVLAPLPLGRDASLLCRTLTQVGLSCTVCSEADLSAELALGVGVLLLTEEALTGATIAGVDHALASQPGWSDLPLVLLINASWRGLKMLDFASAATLLERLAQVRAKRAGNGNDHNGVAELTKREKQVLERMAKGQNNAAIATELGVAEQTIRNYITNLYDKLGVHSRVEAVVWARERGLASF